MKHILEYTDDCSLKVIMAQLFFWEAKMSDSALIIPTISAVIRDIGFVVGIYISVKSLNAWRKEYVGKKKIELAENVLLNFYEAKDVVALMRSPASFASEGSSREARESETERETEIFNRAYIVYERFHNNKGPFNELRTLKYRFKAVYGETQTQPFDDLNQVINRVFVAADLLSRYWLQQGGHFRTEEQREMHLQRMYDAEDVFWSGSDDDDEIVIELDRIIESIENTCRPIITE